MTNLQKAAEQGNQAAPNLLDAIKAGEVGGGGSAPGFIIQYYTSFIADSTVKVYTEDEALAAAQNMIARWQEDYPNLSSVRFAAMLEFPKVAEPQSSDDKVIYFYVTQSAIDTWLEKIDWLGDIMIVVDSEISPELIAEAKALVEGLTPNTLFQADQEIADVVIEFGSVGKLGYQPWPLAVFDDTLVQATFN